MSDGVSDGDELARVIARALEEDRADDDITTLAIVPDAMRGLARLVAREACVLAGTGALRAAFEIVDPDVKVVLHASDGEIVPAGAVVATIEGRLRPILTVERTVLNVLQHLSGVATLTRVAVDIAGATEVRDTRKTTPGLRTLEKAAVRAGGGVNHRSDLAAAVLIKDNHIAVAGSIAAAVAAAKATGGHVEVECDTIEQVREAVNANADEILLDNMDIATMKAAVALVAGRARTEASGGITLATLADVAGTGVDAVSLGALTHSAPAIDLSLEIEPSLDIAPGAGVEPGAETEPDAGGQA